MGEILFAAPLTAPCTVHSFQAATRCVLFFHFFASVKLCVWMYRRWGVRGEVVAGLAKIILPSGIKFHLE